MAKATPLQVVVTQEMRARIVAVAKRDQISQAQVIRDVLDAALEARERLKDAAEGEQEEAPAAE